MVEFKHSGSFNNTESFLKRVLTRNYRHILEEYGRKGVLALEQATPKDSGKTAQSWTYDVDISNGQYTVTWSNTNVVNYVPIAIILQYGHATGNGGYVQGRDYINLALRPIFDEMSNELWKEVSKP